MQKNKPATVDEYIAATPIQAQEKLNELRSILRNVVPNATESLKWGNPVFEEKRILFAYAAFKTHLNFMPTPSAITAFKEDLNQYPTASPLFNFHTIKNSQKD